MPRYRLDIEYDGGPFKGWQSQQNGPSVQDAIERAVERFCGQNVRLAAAGRTDTGVHATGQVAHVDLDRAWPERTVMEALNAHLVPAPVTILKATQVSEDFHARFSATGRRYLYRILNGRPAPALDRGRVWWIKKRLDVAAMAEAARALTGRHDFTTFRDAQCQAQSPVKTLDVADITSVGEEVRLTFAARSFLHRQVRSMTGSLVEVGLGRWTVGDLADALAATDRSRCGTVAPAEGLYLTGILYD
ncbi:MAG: tRNA pseudouridine(38-40) synthase TruA [Caulobacteraceae bacterium]|nr:tRNA pseudouridine(38-40) synthase TruA [Caulobacteraceae bacterium]